MIPFEMARELMQLSDAHSEAVKGCEEAHTTWLAYGDAEEAAECASNAAINKEKARLYKEAAALILLASR
jgi:hypothetical protein